jgi:hypothetical protein
MTLSILPFAVITKDQLLDETHPVRVTIRMALAMQKLPMSAYRALRHLRVAAALVDNSVA